jgi:hypothetical protein
MVVYIWGPQELVIQYFKKYEQLQLRNKVEYIQLVSNYMQNCSRISKAEIVMVAKTS